MTRMQLVTVVAERLDIDLWGALVAVDSSVPREAYDAHDMIPLDDVETWIDRIGEDRDGHV